jgi:hypothetical protein
MSGPRSAWISAILDKSFLGETQVRLRHRELSWPLRNPVPKGLQVPDLLGFGQRVEALGLCNAGTCNSPLAFARS